MRAHRLALATTITCGLTLGLAPSTATAQPRSLRTAYTLSGTGTGVAAGLFLSAFLVPKREGDVSMPLLYAGLGTAWIAPSLGQFYTGRYLTLGFGVRTAAVGLATFAVVKHTQTVRCNASEVFAECTDLSQNAYALLGLAAIAFVGGAALDFKELPENVELYNQRHGFTIAPAIVPVTGAGVGLGAVGTF